MRESKSAKTTIGGPVVRFKAIDGMTHGLLNFNLPLKAGENIIRVYGVDTAGNVSEPSDSLIVYFDMGESLNNFIRKSEDDLFTTPTIRRQYFRGQLDSYKLNATVDECNVALSGLSDKCELVKLRTEQTIREHPTIAGDITNEIAGATGIDPKDFQDILSSSSLSIAPSRQIATLFDQAENIGAGADYIIYSFDITSTAGIGTTGSAGTEAWLLWQHGRYIGRLNGKDHHLFMRPTGRITESLGATFKKAVLVLYCMQLPGNKLPARSVKIDAINTPVINNEVKAWTMPGFSWIYEQNVIQWMKDAGIPLLYGAFPGSDGSITDPNYDMRPENFVYDIYDGKLTRIELDITDHLKYLVAGHAVLSHDYPDLTFPIGLNGIRLSVDTRDALAIFTEVAMPHILIWDR